ncbi:MAG TPA: M56 family metallopeptidase [Steroidobacteraceae bacterium]|jgi:beta-lactamase regulating signal transducer with metallopeptidase domain|nr:M56 family metallopeptidase [Steroidobacteraceae bacterium]
MGASLARVLIEATFASSIAVLIVWVLRKPLRRTTGAQSAYWAWLLVPATALAVFLPAPGYKNQLLASPLPNFIGATFSNVVETISAGESSTNYVTFGLATWLLGALLMSAVWAIRHRAFVRTMGNLEPGLDGVLRSDAVVAPMVIGAWRARVIVPTDFETRYTAEERQLMLAHERAHLERGDTLIYAVAAGWLCLFWFNPLMYWALGRLRFDQDLACDALVVSRSGASRRRYADALLRVQMPIDSAWCKPVACHWKSSHPLKERIIMLKYSSPGRIRRASGVAIAVALAVSGICAVTFATPPTPAQSPTPGSVDSTAKRITIDAKDTDTRDVLKMIADKSSQNFLVSDEVRGKITVHLKDIPWTKALNTVVLSQGLVTRQSGDITLIDVAH